MRSKAPRPKQTKSTRDAPPAMYYRIHALLHTMHAIEQYEDQLCALMHEIQTTGAVSPVVSDELQDLLSDIPSHQYQDELNAVHQALVPAGSARVSVKRSSSPARNIRGEKSTRALAVSRKAAKPAESSSKAVRVAPKSTKTLVKAKQKTVPAKPRPAPKTGELDGRKRASVKRK